MIGRDAPGPKKVDEMPGSRRSVSPIEFSRRFCRSSPLMTETPMMVSFSARLSGEAVTTISSAFTSSNAKAGAAAETRHVEINNSDCRRTGDIPSTDLDDETRAGFRGQATR